MSDAHGSSSAIESGPPINSSCKEVPAGQIIRGVAGEMGVTARSVSSELLRVKLGGSTTTIDEGRLECLS